MCGIAGAWGAVADATVAEMAAALAHRGPDAAGRHVAGPLRLASRRLSIVDVAGGDQPVYNETGEICVVANAEIYNHRELRAHLRARGHRFASHCDTEVIVHLYEEYGERCVDRLEGMFAFAIADGQRLILARDRLGIKPLYTSTVPGAVLFASEAKALLRCPAVRSDLDMQAFTDDQLLGHPVGDRTFLEGVRSLPPGHLMVVTGGARGPETRTSRYYRPPAEDSRPVSLEAARDELVGLLRDVVRSHLAADVEVGFMLSGGLDSTVLAVAASEAAGRPRPAFSVGGAPHQPDLVQAARLADSLNWPLDAVLVDFDDYLDAVPGYTHAFERPGRLGAMPLHLLARRAATAVKACVSGEGADELFGGYPVHLDRRARQRSVEGRAGAVGRLGIAPSPRALEIVESLTDRHPLPTYIRRTLSDYLREQLVWDHLEPLDKCAMAAGLEVRVPFLDHRLVEFVTALPARYRVNAPLGIRKYLLKSAALHAWGGNAVLVEGVLRRKAGAPTATAGYETMLTELCERELPDTYLARHELGFCFPDKCGLLLHELFCELFVTGRGVLPDGFSMREFIRERARGPVPARV